jgi:hypothetical protein
MLIVTSLTAVVEPKVLLTFKIFRETAIRISPLFCESESVCSPYDSEPVHVTHT